MLVFFGLVAADALSSAKEGVEPQLDGLPVRGSVEVAVQAAIDAGLGRADVAAIAAQAALPWTTDVDATRGATHGAHRSASMTDAQGEERRIVRWRRRAVVFLLVVAGVLVVRAIADMWLGGALNAEIARLEDRHGPLRWDSIRKIHPWKTWPRRFAPDNRARLIDAAAARITVATDEHENLLLRVKTQPETMTGSQVREIADGNREAVELAIRAARLPHSNWNIECCGGIAELTDVIFLSTILAVTARDDTDAGRADAAAADVVAGFAIATAMSSEPASPNAAHRGALGVRPRHRPETSFEPRRAVGAGAGGTGQGV